MTARPVIIIHRRPCIEPGTRYYLRGDELLGKSTPEHRALLALFKLTETPPAGTDAIALAPADFDAFMAELELEGAR